MKPNKYELITCPHCGREYLASEIFMPKSFLGNPKDIIRDIDGKILYYDGDIMNLCENYICDGCNKPFKTTARVSFKTEENSKIDFEDDYSTPLYEQLTLFEDL